MIQLSPRRPDVRALCGAAAVSAIVGLASPALAQQQQPAAKPSSATEAVQQRDQELEALRAEQKKSIQARQKLESEIDTLAEDRRKLNQSLIDAAATIRANEERIAASEARAEPLAESERTLRTSLEDRRAVIAEVLAALQRMGRRPPPAIMVKPEDALESLRTAMLLGAVLPGMRHEAQALAIDLGSLAQVRKDLGAERERLAAEMKTLAEQRERMAGLIVERQERQAEAERTLEAERQRSTQLARMTDNLKDLIAKLEQGLDPATRAARSAARAAEENASASRAVLNDPGRLTPAIAFASAKGSLRVPVNGIKTRDFGAADGAGGTEKGLSITTRPGAQVTSPCDGWVVYAAPYRSYGQLLILNAGGGYHVLLAGLERMSVDVGQFVLTGEPVAVMGSAPQAPSTGVSGGGQPVLYIEFRKDGIPVDPNPWWVTNESEKVRG
jgi:septal ring factor EnvC (AmiA/AmiB activator)